ncbi:MAG: HlyD family type I secretion periplasmic adaptor subunit [Pseudohongiellaceae bacterium]|nr:HlyD family type I secretion periplasmic adaptor subunit [Pseudohongiellaceae bacterium]
MSEEKENFAVVPAESARGEKARAQTMAVSDEEPIAPEQDYASMELSFATIKRIGLILVLVVFGGFGSWALLAPIEGAAHAPGTVTVKSYKKVIQHLEGGIVEKLYVQDGDLVQEGDPILELDRTQSESQLEMANGQMVALLALEARLIAERDNKESISFPSSLDPNSESAKAEMLAQTEIFNARRTTQQGRKAVLEQRIEQLRSRLEGLKSLKATKETLAASFAEEVADVENLLQDGFADKNRLRTLERSLAAHQGEAAELVSTISSTEMQIGETRLEILQLNNEFQSEVATHLSDTQTKLADTRERVNVLQDILERTVVRAPVDGVVTGMQVHTEGGVIGRGTPLAEIVPQSDDLVIESHVSPVDIDRVVPGQEANIRFSSFGRKVPTINGHVLTVSADALIDQSTGASYYLARISVLPEDMVELGDLSLVPGMPAEVFINSGSRTFFQYATKPFSNALARALKED